MYEWKPLYSDRPEGPQVLYAPHINMVLMAWPDGTWLVHSDEGPEKDRGVTEEKTLLSAQQAAHYNLYLRLHEASRRLPAVSTVEDLYERVGLINKMMRSIADREGTYAK